MNWHPRPPRLTIVTLGLLALCAAAAPLSAQDNARGQPAHQDSTRVLDRIDPDRAERTLVTREGSGSTSITPSPIP